MLDYEIHKYYIRFWRKLGKDRLNTCELSWSNEVGLGRSSNRQQESRWVSRGRGDGGSVGVAVSRLGMLQESVAAWGVRCEAWAAAWVFFFHCVCLASLFFFFFLFFFPFIFGFHLFRLFLLLGFHFSYWRGATYWRIEKKVAVQRENVSVAIRGEEKVKSKVLPPNGKRNA